MELKLKVNSSAENSDQKLISDWDLAPSSSTLHLFHAHEQFKENKMNLEMKQIHDQKEKSITIGNWNDLHINKRALTTMFETTHDTIKDNKASMYRFNEKIIHLECEQKLIAKDIEKTKLEITKYLEIKEKMEKYVKIYSDSFIVYLESLAQDTPEFNSVQDILNKYETLENCRQECLQKLTTELDETTVLKKVISKIVEEKSYLLKRLDNALVMIETRRENAATLRNHLDSSVKNIEELIANKSQLRVSFEDGCRDLYKEICKQRKVKPAIDKMDFESQLKYIENSIIFYKEVIRIANILQQQQQPEVKTDETIKTNDVVKAIIQAGYGKAICTEKQRSTILSTNLSKSTTILSNILSKSTTILSTDLSKTFTLFSSNLSKKTI